MEVKKEIMFISNEIFSKYTACNNLKSKPSYYSVCSSKRKKLEQLVHYWILTVALMCLVRHKKENSAQARISQFPSRDENISYINKCKTFQSERSEHLLNWNSRKYDEKGYEHKRFITHYLNIGTLNLRESSDWVC